MAKKPSNAQRKRAAAQRKRAAGLRKLIAELTSGAPPADAPAKTPREITDGAARRKWLRERRKKA